MAGASANGGVGVLVDVGKAESADLSSLVDVGDVAAGDGSVGLLVDLGDAVENVGLDTLGDIGKAAGDVGVSLLVSLDGTTESIDLGALSNVGDMALWTLGQMRAVSTGMGCLRVNGGEHSRDRGRQPRQRRWQKARP